MLVLTRKESERIMLTGNIVITVCRIQGDRVRLGIEAPKEVSVHRQEVYERIQAEHGITDPYFRELDADARDDEPTELETPPPKPRPRAAGHRSPDDVIVLREELVDDQDDEPTEEE